VRARGPARRSEHSTAPAGSDASLLFHRESYGSKSNCGVSTPPSGDASRPSVDVALAEADAVRDRHLRDGWSAAESSCNRSRGIVV
jgi:hypothetical protein